MTCQLVALAFDANDPLRLARFWAEALRWDVGEVTDDFVSLVPTDGTRFKIDFGLVPAEVNRLISLGARRIDIGQGDVDWVVMADPDDNEFCMLTPRCLTDDD